MEDLRKFLSSPNNLMCFSPAVMIATVIIELGLAAMIIARYKMGPTRWVIVAILICLGGFQLAEFNVCGQYGDVTVWSRLGYALITMLPALGIHLNARLYQRPTKFIWIPYAIAVAFAGIFAFLPNTLNQSVCTGNYVIFQLSPNLSQLWSHYYLSFVLLGVLLAGFGASYGQTKARPALRWLAIGYLAFLIPTYIIYYVIPSTGQGIPSIMCGFAVSLAIVLGLKVAPKAEDGHS